LFEGSSLASGRLATRLPACFFQVLDWKFTSSLGIQPAYFRFDGEACELIAGRVFLTIKVDMLTFAVRHVRMRFLIGIREANKNLRQRAEALWVTSDENAGSAFGDLQASTNFCCKPATLCHS
jgi:hypothetical protein